MLIDEEGVVLPRQMLMERIASMALAQLAFSDHPLAFSILVSLVVADLKNPGCQGSVGTERLRALCQEVGCTTQDVERFLCFVRSSLPASTEMLLTA